MNYKFQHSSNDLGKSRNANQIRNLGRSSLHDHDILINSSVLMSIKIRRENTSSSISIGHSTSMSLLRIHIGRPVSRAISTSRVYIYRCKHVPEWKNYRPPKAFAHFSNHCFTHTRPRGFRIGNRYRSIETNGVGKPNTHSKVVVRQVWLDHMLCI